MASLNKVIIIGHLGKDPEVRNFPNGGKVCNLNVATSESWKDKNTGDRKERTEWHRVSIFSDPIARIAEQYLRKGSKVYLEGQLETRKWQDQQGQDRYTTEISLRPYSGTLKLLDKREGNEQSGDDDYPPADGGYGSAGGQQQPPGSGYQGDIDDEIPF